MKGRCIETVINDIIQRICRIDEDIVNGNSEDYFMDSRQEALHQLQWVLDKLYEIQRDVNDET